MAHDLVTELLQYSSLACFMAIWQLCANMLIPNCLRSNLSYSPLAALELYVNVLKASIYCSKAFKKEFAEERMLIEQGDKYQPIKKYYVDLSKMTDANKRKALGENRKWALKLTGLYRDAAVQALERDGEVLSQDVVVVVTIKDPRHRGTIYTECLDLLEQRGYVHNDINIHNDIRVDN